MRLQPGTRFRYDLAPIEVHDLGHSLNSRFLLSGRVRVLNESLPADDSFVMDRRLLGLRESQLPFMVRFDPCPPVNGLGFPRDMRPWSYSRGVINMDNVGYSRMFLMSARPFSIILRRGMKRCLNPVFHITLHKDVHKFKLRGKIVAVCFGPEIQGELFPRGKIQMSKAYMDAEHLSRPDPPEALPSRRVGRFPFPS